VSILFEPQRIGRLEIANRFVRSATHYGLADGDGCIGQPSVDLMKTLAGGNVGLIITGFAFVARDGQVFADMNGIDRDVQIAGVRRMAEAVHELDGRIVMQIAHGGTASLAVARRGDRRLAVSLPDPPPKPGAPLREMTEEDIGTTIDAFAQAAGRVQEAGFDGVQIHCAHGYLVTQFLSPRANRRQDRWGGSLENRMRFAVEIARAIRRHVDDDFPVMAKLGCRDYLDEGEGLTIEEGTEVAAALEREGVCFIEVSHGIAERSFRKKTKGKKTAPIAQAYLLPDAEVIRQSTSVPLALVGGMRSLPVMEAVVQSGAADCISICRPLIREPDLIKRWTGGDTRPADCISCGGCFAEGREARTVIRCRQLREAEPTTGTSP
jgi:2,4-dienoyl-CoA reductase-like NADH-dependent reductase (Old Yellow Enzyme family)